MKHRIYQLAQASLLCIALSACQPQPVELQENFSFESSFRPGGNLFASFNKAIMEEAEKAGKDSALQFAAPENAPPVYEDIEFRPVLKAEELQSLTENPLGKSEYAAQVSAIDFNTHFAFMVGHPDSYETHYFDELKASGSGKGILKLRLNCKRLGSAKSGIAGLMQRWKTKVYVVERKQYDSLRVALYEDEYPFSLKDR